MAGVSFEKKSSDKKLQGKLPGRGGNSDPQLEYW
jgi:hypothetical protein